MLLEMSLVQIGNVFKCVNGWLAPIKIAQLLMTTQKEMYFIQLKSTVNQNVSGWEVNTDLNKTSSPITTQTQSIYTMSVPQPQGIPQPSWDTESLLPCFWGTEKKENPVRLCTACQKHCSSKVICSKVHYHHHLWWWIPYDGGRPAAASTHNDILLLLAVTPRQMAHSQQPACQTEHTHTIPGWVSPPETGGQQEWRLKGRLHLWEGRRVQSSQHVTVNIIVRDILIWICFVVVLFHIF